MKTIKNIFRNLLRYPSAIFGLSIIAFLLVVAAYALIRGLVPKPTICGPILV
jgi:hypothetical protein